MRREGDMEFDCRSMEEMVDGLLRRLIPRIAGRFLAS